MFRAALSPAKLGSQQGLRDGKFSSTQSRFSLGERPPGLWVAFLASSQILSLSSKVKRVTSDEKLLAVIPSWPVGMKDRF